MDGFDDGVVFFGADDTTLDVSISGCVLTNVLDVGLLAAALEDGAALEDEEFLLITTLKPPEEDELDRGASLIAEAGANGTEDSEVTELDGNMAGEGCAPADMMTTVTPTATTTTTAEVIIFPLPVDIKVLNLFFIMPPPY